MRQERRAETFSRRGEADRFQSVVQYLRQVEDGGPPVQAGMLPLLSQALGLEKTVVYACEREGAAHRLTFVESAGFPPGAASRELGACVASSSSWGFFNPMRPEPAQRNSAVVLQLDEKLMQLSRPGTRRSARPAASSGATLTLATHSPGFQMIRGLRLFGQWQLRVLVCEEDALLAWVGGFRAEPFGPRERRLLQALTPALQRRLGLEQLLRQGPLARASLAAALEEVPSAAFLVDAAGAVKHANTVGGSRLNLQPAATRAELREAVAGHLPTLFRRTPVRGAGLAPHWLLVANCPRGAEAQLAAAKRRWALTARQVQVLGLLIRGEANKTISLHLACAVRTVEQHVTAVLAKAGVDSRSALAAKFWQST